jgi:hypothetical protein
MKFAPFLLLGAGATLLAASEPIDTFQPVLVHLGPMTLQPSAFLDLIGMSRSATTADSVSTHFGNIPLEDTPGESLGSPRHSRLMLKGDLPAGPFRFSAYLESDFLNLTPGESPYRWRHYWGQAAIGNWEILGGQTWSLLRSNRVGTGMDAMNTDVIDPAYHVGLIGSRLRQIRVSRTMGVYKAAVAWEGVGNVVAKIVRDTERQHYELAGFGGRTGRGGVAASAAVGLTPRLRLVTQVYWSRRAAYEELAVVPVGVNGGSTLEGIEVQVRKHLEVYSYGGLVYAAQASASGNRRVWEWTAGVSQKVGLHSLRSGLLMSLQYSHIDRAIWAGNGGAMDYLMYRFRYTFN